MTYIYDYIPIIYIYTRIILYMYVLYYIIYICESQMSLVFKVLTHKIDPKEGSYCIYTHLEPQVMYIHTQYPPCCRHIPTFDG